MNNEDIKVLEEYVEEFNENKKKYKMVYSTGFGKYWADFVQAIENLIKGYKELEEKNQDLKCNYDNMAEQKEELEQKINYIDAEKELLVAQLKEEKLYGNKVTLELKGDNLPDILTKDYIPNERLIHYMDVALENSKQCLKKGNKIRANEEYKRYKDLKDIVDDLVYHKTLAKGDK